MPVIQRTTLTPNKLELLASWLPAQSWYLGGRRQPQLTKAGGFRLDDPRGEVGIESMTVTDAPVDRPLTYQVPLSYRGKPLDGADHALIGTAEHGVLGRRWIYDGTHDPVVVAQLFALILGEAQPQAQSTSNTSDPTVTSYFTETGYPAPIKLTEVTDGPHGTDLLVPTVAAPGRQTRTTRQLTIRLIRILQPHRGESSARTPQALGHVTAGWLLPNGAKARGLFAVVRDTTPG